MADERFCERGFFIEIGGFAELRVAASFFVTGDTLAAADRVRIEDIVVADPEFEGEVGAEWNGAAELGKVADGPRRAEEKYEREGKKWDTSGKFGDGFGARGGPKK